MSSGGGLSSGSSGDTEARLQRDSLNTPWGFRLQGGKDFKAPLTVQRVFVGSPADGELHRGDVILTIEGQPARSLTHREAQDIIRNAGGVIRLSVRRAFGFPTFTPSIPRAASAIDTSGQSFGQARKAFEFQQQRTAASNPSSGARRAPEGMLSRVKQTLDDVLWSPWTDFPSAAQDSDIHHHRPINQLRGQYEAQPEPFKPEPQPEEYQTKSVLQRRRDYETIRRSNLPVWPLTRNQPHYATLPRKGPTSAPATPGGAGGGGGGGGGGGRVWSRPDPATVGSLPQSLLEPGWSPGRGGANKATSSRWAPVKGPVVDTSYGNFQPQQPQAHSILSPRSRGFQDGAVPQSPTTFSPRVASPQAAHGMVEDGSVAPAWAGTLRSMSGKQGQDLQSGVAHAQQQQPAPAPYRPPHRQPQQPVQPRAPSAPVTSSGGRRPPGQRAPVEAQPFVPPGLEPGTAYSSKLKTKSQRAAPGFASASQSSGGSGQQPQRHSGNHQQQQQQQPQQQYNSPLKLYSQESASEAHRVQSRGAGEAQVTSSGGAPQKTVDFTQSAAYRAVKEEERGWGGAGGPRAPAHSQQMAAPQRDRQSRSMYLLEAHLQEDEGAELMPPADDSEYTGTSDF